MADRDFDADELRAATFVRHVEIHDALASTNDRAAQLAADSSIAMPALVVARQQTAGRGRGQHSWWSADGSLTFSVVIDAAQLGIHTSNWPKLSLAAAVAISDALDAELATFGQPVNASRRPSALRVAIKWPNDIMLDDAKVCGILIESPGGSAPAKNRLIIGIGINVNNSWCSAPREAGAHGTALCDATGRRHSLPELLIATLREIQPRIDQLAANDPGLSKTWQQRSWLTNRRVQLLLNGNWTDGLCQEMNDDGALVIETALGLHQFTSGSVRVP